MGEQSLTSSLLIILTRFCSICLSSSPEPFEIERHNLSASTAVTAYSSRIVAHIHSTFSPTNLFHYQGERFPFWQTRDRRFLCQRRCEQRFFLFLLRRLIRRRGEQLLGHVEHYAFLHRQQKLQGRREKETATQERRTQSREGAARVEIATTQTQYAGRWLILHKISKKTLLNG